MIIAKKEIWHKKAHSVNEEKREEFGLDLDMVCKCMNIFFSSTEYSIVHSKNRMLRRRTRTRAHTHTNGDKMMV